MVLFHIGPLSPTTEIELSVSVGKPRPGARKSASGKSDFPEPWPLDFPPGNMGPMFPGGNPKKSAGENQTVGRTRAD